MSKLPETYVPGFHDEAEIRKMKYTKLGNTGMMVSQLSLGTGGFCTQYGEYTLEECKATLVQGLKKGINYIDTAPWYGHGVSEEVLGKCLEGVPRQAYYIATKVGRYERDPLKMFDFSAEKTRESIKISLEKLGVEYIDVLQVHDVEFAPTPLIILEETLPVLAEAVSENQVKFIGITGYPVSVLADYIKKSTIKIDTVLSYCRLSLIDNTLKEFLPFFQSKNLGIINAATHCMGLLSSFGPQDWHPAPNEIKDICAEARQYCKEKRVELGKLALYYALQQKGPHTHLVGMNTRKLLDVNLNVVLNGLNADELQVYDYVENKIIKRLKKSHWEHIECDRYWKIINGQE